MLFRSHARYQSLYGIYRDLYGALRPFYERLQCAYPEQVLLQVPSL